MHTYNSLQNRADNELYHPILNNVGTTSSIRRSRKKSNFFLWAYPCKGVVNECVILQEKGKQQPIGGQRDTKQTAETDWWRFKKSSVANRTYIGFVYCLVALILSPSRSTCERNIATNTTDERLRYSRVTVVFCVFKKKLRGTVFNDEFFNLILRLVKK